VNQELRLVGAPNSHRYPDYFSLNLQLERRFRLLHYEWAFRIGFNNITGHDNPTVVNNNIDSPNYGQFSAARDPHSSAASDSSAKSDEPADR